MALPAATRSSISALNSWAASSSDADAHPHQLADARIASEKGANRARANAIVLVVGSHRPEADDREYPDIDLRASKHEKGFVHRDGSRTYPSEPAATMRPIEWWRPRWLFPDDRRSASSRLLAPSLATKFVRRREKDL